MFTKSLIATVLVSFICAEFVSSLTCYSCVNVADCRKQRKITCSNAAANETSNYLRVFHQNVRDMNSLRFDCLALKYTYANNNSVVHQLKGCVHPDVNACSLALKPEYGTWRRAQCLICSGNKCNKSNDSPVPISSSFYTILGAALSLVLVKHYT